MNPLTNVKNITKLSEQELKRGSKSSWHDQYKDSAWIFVGGLPYDLTEGDVLSVFSQYGEIVHINLVRDKVTGKQKGFCFVCYEDQRSTILAVDNLNAIKILGRIIRVDHVESYKVPKESKKFPTDIETKILWEKGCAPNLIVNPLASTSVIEQIDIVDDEIPIKIKKEDKKHKKDKKKSKKNKKDKKSKKRKRRSSSSSDSSSESSNDSSDHRSKRKKR